MPDTPPPSGINAGAAVVLEEERRHGEDEGEWRVVQNGDKSADELGLFLGRLEVVRRYEPRGGCKGATDRLRWD